MRIGMAFGDVRGSLPLAEIVAQVADARAAGFRTAWFAQALGWDALTSIAVAGRVDGIELGTAVVPIPQRHPLVLASQALTAQAATGNRLTLGIGAGIGAMVSNMYGLPTDHPVRRMREYLQVLRPLLRGEAVTHEGKHLTANGRISLPAPNANSTKGEAYSGDAAFPSEAGAEPGGRAADSPRRAGSGGRAAGSLGGAGARGAAGSGGGPAGSPGRAGSGGRAAGSPGGAADGAVAPGVLVGAPGVGILRVAGGGAAAGVGGAAGRGGVAGVGVGGAAGRCDAAGRGDGAGVGDAAGRGDGAGVGEAAGLGDGGGVVAPGVLVGALGAGMLRVAGEVGDGAITWMTGPRTLAEHVVPTITKAAAEAGRSAPRVVAGLAVCVTDDEAAAREWFGRQYAMAGQVPEYRAMLDREGVDSPADLLITGTEASVARSLARLEQTGITDLMATPVGSPQAQQRTTQALAALLTP